MGLLWEDEYFGEGQHDDLSYPVWVYVENDRWRLRERGYTWIEVKIIEVMLILQMDLFCQLALPV